MGKKDRATEWIVRALQGQLCLGQADPACRGLQTEKWSPYSKLPLQICSVTSEIRNFQITKFTAISLASCAPESQICWDIQLFDRPSSELVTHHCQQIRHAEVSHSLLHPHTTSRKRSSPSREPKANPLDESVRTTICKHRSRPS